MARVVQRRSGPPYLLIIAVFLFLIAATLAVLQYMEADKAKKEIVTLKGNINNLASPEERSGGLVQEMLNARQKATGGVRNTVIGQFAQREAALVQAIDPTAADYQTALKEAGNAFDLVGSRRGLATELKEKHRRLGQTRKEVEKLNREKETLQEQISKADQAAGKQVARFDAERAGLKDQIRALDEKLNAEQKDHEEKQQAVREEYKQKIDELNKNIAAKAQQIQELQLEKQRLEVLNAKLTEQIKDLSKPKTGAINVARRPDGKIMKVLEGQDVVYINIGAKDRVVVGLTFSVYPPSGIPETGEGKGNIIVTNVSENISECRIDKQDIKDPIVEDDLIANLAFDSLRTYTFVVEGQFDLYGSGKPSQTGADEVKTLIKKFKGKLAGDVDTDTDFVVMGQEPPRPPKPVEGAPPQVWKVYQGQMKVYNRYRDVKLMAQAMHVPVLNTNRLLAFLGYTPTRTLME